MIFHLRHIPFGIYHYPKDVAALGKLILDQEAAILELPRFWKEDYKSATSARYKYYNFLAFEGTDDFRAFLHKSVDDFYHRLNWPITTYRWLQCWVNVHRDGQFLAPHVHFDCKMSGHMTIACHNSRTTYFNDHTFSLENEPGILTLLGAELVPHFTSPVPAGTTRISVAFDIYESNEKIKDHWVRLEP